MVFLIFLFLSDFQGPGWNISIEPVQYEYIIREPMWFKIEGENKTERELKSISEEGTIEIDGKDCGAPKDLSLFYEMANKGLKSEEDLKYPKGSKKRLSFLLSDICEDRYEMTWWLNDKRDDFYGKHNLCYVRKYKEYLREEKSYEEKEERFCTEFKIIYPPEGEDRDFYNKYLKEKGINEVSQLDDKNKIKAIEEFPTSRYTGWILDRFYPLFISMKGEDFLKELKGEANKVSEIIKSSLKGKEMNLDERKIMKIFAEGGEKFLKRHKSHPLNEIIYTIMAFEFFYLGEREKGILYGEEGLKGEWQWWYKYFYYDPSGEIIRYGKSSLKSLIETLGKNNKH